MAKGKKFIDNEQIPYDMRTSCFINTGSYYGVGKTNPVGKEEATNNSPIPQESYRQDVYEKIFTNEEKLNP